MRRDGGRPARERAAFRALRVLARGLADLAIVAFALLPLSLAGACVALAGILFLGGPHLLRPLLPEWGWPILPALLLAPWAGFAALATRAWLRSRGTGRDFPLTWDHDATRALRRRAGVAWLLVPLVALCAEARGGVVSEALGRPARLAEAPVPAGPAEAPLSEPRATGMPPR